MTPAPARERILDTAFRLFYARGIRAVGVDLLIAESGVAKATFYKHFGAKDDLVLAYLDRVDEIWTGQLRAAAQAAGPDPADQLVGLFDALGTACRREGYRGCAFINAVAEVGGSLPDAVAIARRHKQEMTDVLADLLPPGPQQYEAAHAVAVAVDGAIVQAQMAGGAAALAALKQLLALPSA